MSQKSDIEWTDATWPVVQGCDYASPGCKNCYAVRTIWRLAHNPNPKISERLQGLTDKHGEHLVWTGKLVLRPDRLRWPLSWRKPRRIFVPSHGDLFHEGMPDYFIDQVFAVMAIAHWHTFQVLTKRAHRMRWYLSANDRYERILAAMREMFSDCVHPGALPLPNVWLGVSVEDQRRADARIPHLLATAAAIRFLSCEPVLGPIDLNRIHEVFNDGREHCWESCLNGRRFDPWSDGELSGYPKVDWVICGGESGPGRRPTNPDWHRSLRDQCKASGVAFFEKQIDKVVPIPPDLMVREYPVV